MRNINGELAIIFDLDGVISDTQDLHAMVDSKVLKRFGIFLHPNEITDRFAGTGDKRMFSTLFAEYEVEGIIEQAIDMKWEMMGELITPSTIQPVPYSIGLIQELHRAGIQLSVGSGSPKDYIGKVLEAFSLHQYFEAYVSASEVPQPKPFPDVFLTAANRMNVSPNKCLVIEDGMSGMEAAANAGMACIGLVKDPSKRYPATSVVTSLADVTLSFIDRTKEVHAALNRYAKSAQISQQGTTLTI